MIRGGREFVPPKSVPYLHPACSVIDQPTQRVVICKEGPAVRVITAPLASGGKGTPHIVVGFESRLVM